MNDMSFRVNYMFRDNNKKQITTCLKERLFLKKQTTTTTTKQQKHRCVPPIHTGNTFYIYTYVCIYVCIYIFSPYSSRLTTRGSMGLEFLSLDSSCILIIPSCFKTTLVGFCFALLVLFFPQKLTESSWTATQHSIELPLSIREVVHPLTVKTLEWIYRNNLNTLQYTHYFQEKNACNSTHNASLVVIIIVFPSIIASHYSLNFVWYGKAAVVQSLNSTSPFRT